MNATAPTDETLRAENAELRARLEEAEEMLRAIRAGEVDALMVETSAGPQLFVLQGVDAEQNRMRGEMLAQVSDAVIAVDTEERVTFLNAAAERQYGVRSGDVLGRKLAEIFAPHRPSPEADAPMRTALRERGEWHGELIHRAPDGRELHVDSVSTALRGPDGACTGYVMAIRDIRERKQAAKELYEQQRLYKSLTDNASVSLFIMNERQQCVFMNPAAETLTGFTLDDVRGKALHEVIHHTRPDGSHYPLCECPIDQAFPQNDREQGEEVFVHKDGHFYHVAFTASPIRDRQGKPVGTVIEVEDITERKRTEESVWRLAAIVESSNDALFSEDLDGIVTIWNRGAEDIFGYRADEIIGTSIMRLIPEDRQEADHEMQRNIVAGERGGTFEAIRRRKDGREFHASITVSPLKDAAGKIIGTSRVVRDITERKQAEEAQRASDQRMRLAAEATEVGIWEWNVLTNRLRWDAEMFRIYGIAPTPDGFVTYETWSGAVLPEDLAENESVLQETVRCCGRSARTFRIRRSHDGEVRSIAAVETVRTNAQGEAEWVVGTNLDVTQRLLAEQALRDADRRKDEFLATLAHELRNPLAPIRNGLQIMKLPEVDAGTVEMSRSMMERQVEQMTRLIDDLMDVSRINQNKLQLQKTRMPLADAVLNAVETSRPLIDVQGHELVVDVPSQPIYVDGDLTRLSQVLANLLNNAAKYTERGGRIRLTVEWQGSDVVVSVADNGVGIRADMLARVFDMFAQIDGSLEMSQGGLGIGLNIVKRLVEMHGGSITAESGGPGMGSTFTVRLPVLIEKPKAPGPPDLSSESIKITACRILVVDDNRDAAMSLAMLLKIGGHVTQVAHDGVEAVAKAAEFKPDMVLLDIGLPKMNGYDACRAIREQPWGKDIVIVALTGWGQEDDRHKSKEAGFNGHLVKPVDYAALMKLLAELHIVTA